MSNAKYSELVIDNVVGDVWDKEAIHNADLADIILNSIYPVGSIYFSADADFDPNEAWGGTWDKVEAGRVIVSSGTGYDLGASGGNATHKLTAAECALPSHAHNYYKANTPSGGTALQQGHIPRHNHGEKSLVGTFNIRKSSNGSTAGHTVTSRSGIVTMADASLTGTGAYALGYSTHDPKKVERITITATHTHNNYGGDTNGNTVAHTHTIGSTSTASTSVSQAASDSISLMQPYVAYNMWKRIA